MPAISGAAQICDPRGVDDAEVFGETSETVRGPYSRPPSVIGPPRFGRAASAGKSTDPSANCSSMAAEPTESAAQVTSRRPAPAVEVGQAGREDRSRIAQPSAHPRDHGE